MCATIGLFAAALMLAGCSQGIPPHLKPVPPEAAQRLASKGMSTKDPIFIRIFKKEAELEIWKQKDDGRFHHFKTYPICNFSGKLGPKLKQGDRQSPEGFYSVGKGQLNPKSKFHLAFNLGFPNRFDRAHGYTGAHLMVHGDCTSAGCYAMTDAVIEEIYALARDALDGGQARFHVHAFPFRMTDENFATHRRSKWASFWVQLKRGYDDFEISHQVPTVDICARRYHVNAKFRGGRNRLRPNGPCPPYTRVAPIPWNGIGGDQDRDALEAAFQTVTKRAGRVRSLRPTLNVQNKSRNIITSGAREN
ncbi:MAG: murein L,D-transpeptidase family protein [Pseudomonadota bacterium]